MSKTRRWSKWWWQDWQRDPALRMCSPAARGIWMDMLAIMFDAEPCGHLVVNGRAPNERQLAAVCGTNINELKFCLAELEEAGVFSRTEDGVIFNRRMVRDKAESDEAVKNGKLGGNPALTERRPPQKIEVIKGVNPPHNGAVKQDSQAEGLEEADCSVSYADALSPFEDRTAHNPLKNNEAPGGLTPPLKHQEAEADTDINSSLRSESVGACAPIDGKKRRLVEFSQPKAKTLRGGRLPEDWWPSIKLQDFARTQGCDPQSTAEAFSDYWHSAPSPRGVKLDWEATFRNWCRNEAKRSPSPRLLVGKPKSALAQQAERMRQQWSERCS